VLDLTSGNFKESEFSEDINAHMDPRLFAALDGFRSDYGSPIYPSKAKGALARFDGSKTSQHYAVGRKSTAVDFFTAGNPFLCFCYSLAWFKSVGVYFNTKGNDGKPGVMIHGDVRAANRVLWYVDPNGKYNYYKFSADSIQHMLQLFQRYS